MPEMDIDDAINSISLIIGSPISSRLYISPLFATLTQVALDFSKEIPSKIRKALVEIMVNVSLDPQDKKYLLKRETVHNLIQVALKSCQIEENKNNNNTNGEDEGQFAKESVQILYNLAGFNKPKFYIPGETVKQARDHSKFILLGGLNCLYFIKGNTKIPDIVEFCENSKLKCLELKDVENMITVLKLYSSLSNAVKSNSSKIKEEDNFDNQSVPNVELATAKDINFPQYYK